MSLSSGAQTGVALARLLGALPSIAASGRLEKGLGALDSLVCVQDSRKQTPFDKAVLVSALKAALPLPLSNG